MPLKVPVATPIKRAHTDQQIGDLPQKRKLARCDRGNARRQGHGRSHAQVDLARHDDHGHPQSDDALHGDVPQDVEEVVDGEEARGLPGQETEHDDQGRFQGMVLQNTFRPG
jgi:hypothetical protein